MTANLRRGQSVLIDTDLRFAGQPLRGRRGTVQRLGHAGSAFVCTCATSGALHAHNCPVTLPLARGEVIHATRVDARSDAGEATRLSAVVLLVALLIGGLLWLALLHLGQQAMCTATDHSLRYCAGYSPTTTEETP